MKPAPRIVSNEVAVRIFYEYPFELENSELKILFGTKSTSTLTKIKKEVQRVMMENNIPRRSATSISTKTAYEVWNLNVPEMEKSIIKLRKLNIHKEIK